MVGSVRIYFICEKCHTHFQKDLPKTQADIRKVVQAYQQSIFLHDCTQSGWGNPKGTFGIARIIGGKELE